MKAWIRLTVLLAALTCNFGVRGQDLNEFFSAYNRGNYSAALSGFRPAAEKGDPLAQFMMGQMYEDGVGVNQDSQESLNWFLKSGGQGFALAQANLGLRYAMGNGVPKNEKLAFDWYRKAAEQGLAKAQGRVGIAYFFGTGVEKDYPQALTWARKSAAQNNEWGQVVLGMAHASGNGVPRDGQQSFFWYLKAANQGNTYAQTVVGGNLGLGLGVAKDVSQGYFWSLLAAAGGSEQATTGRDLFEQELTPQQIAAVQAQARTWKPITKAQSDLPSGREPSDADRSTPEPNRALKSAPDSTGSGFVVARGSIVTNHHVVDGCNRLLVNGVTAKVRSSDPRSDLALLGAALPGAGVSLRNQRVSLGESLSVAGYPLRGLLSGFNMTTGNLSSMSGIKGDTQLVQITAPVQPGNSGGPVLDSAGNLMGVVVSKLDAIKAAKMTGDIPQNVNFAINVNVLRSFLDANNVDYAISSSERVIATTLIAEKAKSFTVLVECWQ